MAFSNPITGGQGALVRPAIKSPNFETGVAGWIIRRDGSAEFTDLKIRSSDGSGSVVTTENGRITITDGSGTVVVEIDATGYRLYNASAVLVSEITLADDVLNQPGFISYSTTTPRYAAHVSSGSVWFFADDEFPDLAAFISYERTGEFVDPARLTVSSGYIGHGSGDESAVVQLISDDGSNPARVEIKGDADPAWTAGCDLQVDGGISGGNVATITRKSSATIRTNDATMSDDPHLQAELDANSEYLVKFTVVYGTSGNAGFRTQWRVPTGADGYKTVNGMSPTVNTTGEGDDANGRYGVHVWETDVEYGSRNHSQRYCVAHETAIVRTNGTGGTLALQWCQLTAHADNTEVRETSWVEVTKLQ